MEWSRQKARTSSFSVGSFNKPIHLTEHDRYPNVAPFQQQNQPIQSQLPLRSAYYETHWPLFYSDWKSSSNTDIIAISSFREDTINKLEILSASPSYIEHANGLTSEGLDFVKIAENNVELPITKLQWDPTPEQQVQRLITSSDRLRLWEIDYNNRLIERANLTNSSHHSHSSASTSATGISRPQSLPPITSFDWNKVNPNLVITSSIDTTCTLWDLSHASSPKTQLIAHDSEVLDVQFVKGSPDVFASVGCDGSMRLFDLRALQHSTIIYEPSSNASSALSLNMPSSSASSNPRGHTGSGGSLYAPLLRLATSNTDSNIIATFAAKSENISVLDLRYPGQPTSILAGHSASINSIKWHPTQSKLLSGGDDCQALLWDFSTSSSSGSQTKLNNNIEYPTGAYSDTLEINNVTWNSKGDWFGVVSGKGFQGVKAA